MKKFVAILAIAGSLVACDNAANTEQRTKDSLDSVAKKAKEDSINAAQMPTTPATPIDSPAVTTPMVDSPAMKVDSPAVNK